MAGSARNQVSKEPQRTGVIQSQPEVVERRAEIDWLRICAVLLLIFFHSAVIFCYGNYHVKNDLLSWPFTSFVIFVAHFHMPLFFLLAGASTWFALGFRGGRQYAVERIKRLAVPFLFGLLTIVPAVYYLETISGSAYPHHEFTRGLTMQGFDGNFFEFWGLMFSNGALHYWTHLWFILYLLVFSIVTLPFFLYIKRGAGQRLIPKIAGMLEKPGAIFLPAILLIGVEAILRPPSPWGVTGALNFVNDLPNLVYYGLLFVFGFMVYSSPKIGQAAERHAGVALTMALALSGFILVLYWTGSLNPWGMHPPVYLFIALRGLGVWCWMIGLIGLGRKLLTFKNRFLPYAREAAYPFYILHHVPVLAIGFFVVQTDWGLLPKYLLNCVSSLAVTIVVYDILVRRTNVTRFLFWMRPKSGTLPSLEETLTENRGRIPLEAGLPGDGYYVVCEDLFKIYKIADLEVVALRGLDLRVKTGELMAIVGASGSGKSTLLNILGGLDVPSAGKVVVGNRDLLKITSSDLVDYRRQDAGFVWQQSGRNVIPYLTAYQNVELPLILLGWSQKERRRRTREMLEVVGLADRMEHRPDRLSGGEQQRIAIAIALAHNPPLILADEPTGELDTQTSEVVLDVFRLINDTYGSTVIIVTHDIRVIRKVDRVVTIRDGRTNLEAIRKEPVLTGPEDLSEETHDEFIVVDSAGRLQIPRDSIERLGMGNRVKVFLEGDHLTTWPVNKDEEHPILP